MYLCKKKYKLETFESKQEDNYVRKASTKTHSPNATMENILPWAMLQLPSTKSDKSSFKLSLELKKANKVIGDTQERKEEH